MRTKSATAKHSFSGATKRTKLTKTIKDSGVKVIKKKTEKPFKEVLAEIESRKDWGRGPWDLPENPTLRN